MENPTALVTGGARPTYICGCLKLAAAGWKVQCPACGRGVAVSAAADNGTCTSTSATDTTGRAA